jgi:predicted RNA polymerase sigma factor
MDHIQIKIDQLYKTHFGKLISALLSTFKSLDLQGAEDIIQDSFAIAWTGLAIKYGSTKSLSAGFIK